MSTQDRVSALQFATLQKKRILVTGSSSGIGRSIALAAASAGADVVVHCAQAFEQACTLASQIADMGTKSAVLQADFTKPGEFEGFASSAFEAFGGLDAFVCNAGVDLLTGANRDLGYAEKLDRLIDVDIRASILLCREFGDRFRQQQAASTDPSPAALPSILTIGWDQADRGMEGVSGELFAAAKNAVMGFTRSLAVSLAPDVRVNCIAPGWIRTAWGESASDEWQSRVLKETPLKRWGTPEDIAATARFLLSDAAAYITGQVINVNGGAVR